jgi:cyclophilin family peptidyl-prolyl cis-trans isomerase
MLFGFGAPPPPQAKVTERCFLDVVILSADGRQRFDVGRLELGLFGEAAPECVDRFKRLLVAADAAAPPPLKGVRWHRTLKNFIVQSGQLDDASAFEPFTLERNALKHVEGALSMSQTDGNACTEFFVAVADCSAECDGSYAVFGLVLGGMKEVIKDMDRRAGSSDGAPWTAYEISGCGML